MSENNHYQGSLRLAASSGLLLLVNKVPKHFLIETRSDHSITPQLPRPIHSYVLTSEAIVAFGNAKSVPPLYTSLVCLQQHVQVEEDDFDTLNIFIGLKFLKYIFTNLSQ